MKLGVSVYPEQETIEEIENYLKLANNYGFTRVFTSLFSVQDDKSKIISYFKKLSEIAHNNHMEVIGDCNSKFMQKMEATPSDLSVFEEMGFDVLRMDGVFGDYRDLEMIENKYGIKIELNASEMQAVEGILEAGGNPKKIMASCNFYPLRNTGASPEDVIKVNNFFEKKGIEVEIFISSAVENAHGPWPLRDGLPTIEMHRDIPPSLQLKHLLAMGGISSVIFGNGHASKEEFEDIQKVIKESYVTVTDKEGIFKGNTHFVPEGDILRIPLTIIVNENISKDEMDILFSYDKHNVAEYNHTIFRSRWSRCVFTNSDIASIKANKEYYSPGDIIIINNIIPRYMGELHIVRKAIKAEPYHNYVGHIIDEEMFLLEYLDPGKCFSFVRK